MHSVYVVELHVTINYTKIVLHNNVFMTNLYRRQQYNLRRSSCECPMLNWKKRTFIVLWPSDWTDRNDR